ncbi:MAG: arylsulfatase [Gammaproteobacteria bacterium]
MKNKFVVACGALLVLGACQQSEPEAPVAQSAAPSPEAAAPVTASTGLTPGSRPNILLIVADDLGYQDLSIFGGEMQTPNIDRLFTSGVMMTQFYVSVACQPTRAMLMSGMDHHLAGVGSQGRFIEGNASYQNRLTPGVASTAERMAALGYHTSMVGKWHLGLAEGEAPADRGFERSFVLLEPGAFHFDMIGYGSREGVHYEEDGVPLMSLPEDFYSTITYTDHMIGFLEEASAQDRPFFGYVAYTSPHWPIQALDEDIAKVRGRYDEGYDVIRARRFERMKELGLIPADAAAPRLAAGIVPWNELSAERQAAEIAVMEAYAAMVERMDTEIGRMVARLEALGELDDTLIVFMSDNGAEGTADDGPFLADYRAQWNNSLENIGKRDSYKLIGLGWADGGASADFLTKSSLAQGGIHSPVVVNAPGLGLAPGRSDALVAALDLAPTFVELAGGTNTTTFDGRDVLPMTGRSFSALLRGEIQAIRGDDETLAFEHGGQRAVFRGKWKALWMPPPNGIGDWQLFDLSVDPGETNDLAAANPDVMAELAAAYEQHAADVGVVPPAPPAAPSN